MAGNLFSQFSVAATALLIAFYNLKFRWNIIFAAAYGIIEELFIALHIYQHTWYKTWYTVVGLIVFFWLMKKMYQKSLEGSSSLLHYVNIFFSLITLDVITILWGFILSGYQFYSRHLGYNPVASPYLVANLYSYLVSVSLMIVYFLQAKWRYKLGVIASLYLITFIFGKLSILYFRNDWWYLIFSTTYIWAVYFSIVFMDKLYKAR